MKRVPLQLIVLFIFCHTGLRAQETFYAANGANITIQSGGNMVVNGAVVLADKSRLNNEGVITVSNTGNAGVDFMDRTVEPYPYGSGKFSFEGSGSQEISSANYFGQLEINNGGFNLLSDINSNNWTLKNGRVNTQAFYAVVSSVAADAIRADISNNGFSRSWINGNLRRYTDPQKLNSYLFPVGDARQAHLAEMDELAAKGIRYINASFGEKEGNDLGLNIGFANKICTAVNPGGVWRLVPDAAASGTNYTLKLSLDGFTGLTNNEYSIIQRAGDSYHAADWKMPAGTPELFTGNVNRYATKNNLASFGQFGVGIISMVSPVFTYNETRKENALRVYPNPVINNQFFVEYDGAKVNTVKLVGADGKIVTCIFNLQKSSQLKVILPVFLAKGIYTLQLDSDNGLQSTKINLQ